MITRTPQWVSDVKPVRGGRGVNWESIYRPLFSRMTPLLRSFKPLINKRSRVLILGSMPGPEALRKQQYYGFEGNHFWHIVPKILGEERPASYDERVKLVLRHGIALWDVLEFCTRASALDSDIRSITLNPVPRLINEYPNVRAIFISGRFAHSTFVKGHGDVGRPVFYLPSTSPANAAMSLPQKTKKWKMVLKYLQ
jgi:hypoxanthine-DNA glycosylase